MRRTWLQTADKGVRTFALCRKFPDGIWGRAARAGDKTERVSMWRTETSISSLSRTNSIGTKVWTRPDRRNTSTDSAASVYLPKGWQFRRKYVRS